MKLAFVLLAHGDPELVKRLIRELIGQGHQVAVHYDAKAKPGAFENLTAAFEGEDAVRFAQRARVGWGQWGVVQGALNCLRVIDEAGWSPDYVYQLSGMDYPIRSSAELVSFLRRNRGDEFIESVPADTVSWVKSGPQRERYLYHWWFNWRAQPKLSDFMFWLQKTLGFKRPFVRGITPYIGSQWWVLTWATLKKVMEVAADPEVIAFFKTTLVPDELFFQTLVRHAAPKAHVTNCSLTLYQFTDYGYPVVYYSDHVDYLVRQPFFMARKISPHDRQIRDQLDAYWRGTKSSTPVTDQTVGIVGPEYEDRRLTYRHGPYGSRLIGAPVDGDHGDLGHIDSPLFAIIGTSVTELSLVQALLADQPKVLCHGQLFHDARIAFAEERDNFAGYHATDVAIRDADPGNFLADILRAEKARMSGLLVHLRHGAEIPNMLFDLSNVRMVVLQSNPMLSFLEHLWEQGVLASPTPHTSAITAIHPIVLANHFRRFLPVFNESVRQQNDLIAKARDHKPEGWLVTLDLSADTEQWREALEAALGVQIAALDAKVEETTTSEDWPGNKVKAAVVTSLAKGGMGEIPFEKLEAMSKRSDREPVDEMMAG
jgi:hypothetical protein